MRRRQATPKRYEGDGRYDQSDQRDFKENGPVGFGCHDWQITSQDSAERPDSVNKSGCSARAKVRKWVLYGKRLFPFEIARPRGFTEMPERETLGRSVLRVPSPGLRGIRRWYSR